ncbi:MAG: ABC transporter permease subunit [Christensenellales bacterium]|jgi:simple sugar transport system permease protein
MKPKKSQWIAAGLLLVLALGLLTAGVWGFVLRGQPATSDAMLRMRNYAVLRTAAGAIVNNIYLQAKLDARAYARAQKFSRNQITVYMDEQGELARKAAEEKYYNTLGIDRTELSLAVESFENSLSEYSRLEAAEKEAYAEVWREQQAALAAQKASEETVGTEDETISEDDMMASTIQKVDYSGFVPSAELAALYEALTPAYDAMYTALENALPDLEPEMKDKLREPLIMVVRGGESGFNAEYDSYAATGAQGAFESSEKTRMLVARQAPNLLMLAFGALTAALSVLYYRPLQRSLGMPRLVISAFFILLCILAGLYNINVAGMFSTVLWRTGMYGVLALAMLPGIQAGISLNMGMTVGIIAGLVSTLIALEHNMTGWGAFFFSVIGGIILALPIGFLYGKLLNHLKGSEMTVSTYVGFSVVSLFCIAWMLLPFKNPKLTWALGSGLRSMHNMGDSFGQLLDDFLSFEVLGVRVPTGLLLFFLLCCFIMWLFSRSRTGIAMIAGGANSRFAEAAGVNVNKMRIIGTTISTVIAAVGIIVYSQSFGFMQLYNGPKQMGFVSASAILIGGATVKRAKVSHVIIGTFLFQGVLALGIQVANAAIAEGGLSEVMRILISNGIILYALTQSGGEGRD